MITLGWRSVQYLLEFKSRLKIENVSIVYQVTKNYPISEPFWKSFSLIPRTTKAPRQSWNACNHLDIDWKVSWQISEMLREQKKEKRLSQRKTFEYKGILFEITLQLWQSTWTKSTECTNQLWVRLWTFHVTQILKIAVKSQV